MTNPSLYSPNKPHFFQPLLPGFTNHLVCSVSLSLSDQSCFCSNSSCMLFQDIPVAFVLKHFEGSSQGKTAELRSDASEITWKVKIDRRRISDGWQDFALAHDLRVGDIVVFRHEGELVFHVSPLGPSFCEIHYGEDCDEEDKIEKVSRKKKRPETEADPHSPDQSSFVATVTASNLRRGTLYLPKAFVMSNGLMKKVEIVLMNEEGESSTIDFRHEAYSGRFYIRRG
ncbi:unnamed protein product [Arabis nemorensis]|uniref:TF-B3 domain-containing protein n=1 Tax=Arabis nemorensis TaxID=586526 RepID=A0A565C9B6_9BRAS|nr:unnamed protein product [Arabis nemorensis]